MARTLHDTQTQSQCVKPWRVYSKLRQICRHLVPGHQEDAHEFLRYLVEAMEKAYLLRFRNSKEFDQLTKETTPLNQILGGYLKSSVRCLDCGHCSVTFQHFQDLMLDIRKSSSIDEALDTHFARERLEDMGYKCEACKKKVSATKQFSLERAPIALCVQLKRFSMMGGKMNKHVSFAPRLNLSKYSARRQSGGGPADPQMIYRLVSMVTHLGSSQHCGHYTAVGATSSGGYFTFDDSSVRTIGPQNVLQTNAYIMFYELEDPTAINGGVSPPPQQHHKLGAAATTPTATTTPNGDAKKSFIGPMMPTDTPKSGKIITLEPAVAAKTPNGHIGPAPATTPTTTANGVPKLKPMQNTNSNCALAKTWSGSKLVPHAVRTATANAAANGHHNAINNGTGSNGNAGPPADVSKKVKLLNPFVANKKTTTDNGCATTTPTVNRPTLPSMPNIDLLSTEHPSQPTNPPNTTQSTTTRTTINATTIAFTAPKHQQQQHVNGHAKTTATTPPSSPDDQPPTPSPTPVKTKAHHTATVSTTKTNGHQHLHVTNGFTTTSASKPAPVLNGNGAGVLIKRPLVPYDDDSSDAAGQSEDDSASKKTLPIVRTKAGFFQVTNATPPTVANGNGHSTAATAVRALSPAPSNGSGNSSGIHTTPKKRNTPFTVSPGDDDDDGSGRSGGGSVASKLLKQSHLGYGTSVRTWGDQPSNMDQEVSW